MADTGTQASGGGLPRDDFALQIEALRVRRAERFDPVGFRFVEALARRAAAAPGEAGARVLERRLAKALTDYRERFDRAERKATEMLAGAAARFPDAAEELAREHDAGDFGGLHQRLARLQAHMGPTPLAELLALVGEAASDGMPVPPPPAPHRAEPLRELKSLPYFRSTWSRLKLERQLSHAFAQAPANAGPLNSHFLVLQSLETMRALSPGYLAQFVSYVDALLWLDQAGGGPRKKNDARGEREPAKQRKSRASRRTQSGRPSNET